MREIRQMPLSGYVTLIIWAALMAAFVYGVYAASEQSRGEFLSMFQGSPSSEPTAMKQLQEVPQALKNELQAGLATLADTLAAYQAKVSASGPQ
ncbi:MAG: hypothetical protein RL681_391 [Candidatus Parcubacteria bacterium]